MNWGRAITDHTDGGSTNLCPSGATQRAVRGVLLPQVGYKVVPQRKVPKPELGHLQKSGCPPMKHLMEFKVSMPISVSVLALWLGHDGFSGAFVRLVSRQR
jgi:hypothetical protein